jgi:type IV pilus assembly protein PilE
MMKTITMNKVRGFTILELTIALVIVFLLVAVAVSSFMDHMTRKSRHAAQIAVQDASAWLLQQHVNGNSFLAVQLPDTQVPRDGNAKYRIVLATLPVTATNPQASFPVTTAHTFTVMAVPVGEEACGSLLMDHTGRKGITGSATLSECWQ